MTLYLFGISALKGSSMRLPALAACVTLSACVMPIESATPVALSSQDRAIVQASMSHDLFDPSAAQFRNVRAAIVTLNSGETLRRICGEMNGKNQYGAYVGYENFSGVVENGRWKRDPILSACS